jgi:hypothetical protein
VFEVSITLAAGDDLTISELNSINAQLADHLGMFAAVFGKTRGRISAEQPFEHVTGDWLPPDETGVIRASREWRPIDFDRELGLPR